jgi:predicted nucleic acid-binding Zn ribbon protein
MNCRSDIRVDHGRCIVCGATIKKIQQINLKVSGKDNRKNKSNYTVLSHIFGTLFIFALGLILVYRYL